MIIKDYYKILDFDTNKVTIDEIKSNFRELAKKYHPDVNVGDTEKEERFKDINEAYRVLSDTASRKKYDRIWNANIGKKKAKQQEATKSTESRTSDFFHMFFGNMQEVVEEPTSRNVKKKIPVKGDNVETQIVVSVQEAFYGAEKKISLRTVEGKMKTFTVKIPAGIRNGEKIRLIFALITLKDYQVLFLDEPTNHLDFTTKKILAEILEDYQGCIIMVSHDRYFINKVVNKVIYLQNKDYIFENGNYDDFLQKHNLESNDFTALLKNSKTKKVVIKNEKKENSKLINKIEKEIESLEKKLNEINEKLYDSEKEYDWIEYRSFEEESLKIEEKLQELLYKLDCLEQ